MESQEQMEVEASTSSPQWFATTHWSVVLETGAAASPQANQALENRVVRIGCRFIPTSETGLWTA